MRDETTEIRLPWGGAVSVRPSATRRRQAGTPVLLSAQALLTQQAEAARQDVLAPTVPSPVPVATPWATEAVRSPVAVQPGLARSSPSEWVPPRQWVEWVGRSPGTGAMTFLDALLRQVRQAGHFAALVDAADSLDPATLSPQLGEGLLWVRCPDLGTALRALDIVLRDPNFHLVVADLRRHPARGVASTAWYRLQRLVTQRAGRFLCLADQPMAPSADQRWVLPPPWHLADLAKSRRSLHAQTLHHLRHRAAQPGTEEDYRSVTRDRAVGETA